MVSRRNGEASSPPPKWADSTPGVLAIVLAVTLGLVLGAVPTSLRLHRTAHAGTASLVFVTLISAIITALSLHGTVVRQLAPLGFVVLGLAALRPSVGITPTLMATCTAVAVSGALLGWGSSDAGRSALHPVLAMCGLSAYLWWYVADPKPLVVVPLGSIALLFILVAWPTPGWWHLEREP